MTAIREATILVALLALAPLAASAAPVRWTVQSAFFNDGGRLVGSFIYDADTQTYSNVALTTFGGLYPGDFYPIWEPSQDRTPGRSLTAWVSTTGGLLGQKELYIPFIGTLTNAGGTRNPGTFIEGPCAEIGPLTGNVCLITQSRTGFGGTLVGTPLPVPGAVWLLGSAIGMLGWMSRRIR